MAIVFVGLAIFTGSLAIAVSLDKLRAVSYRYEFIAVNEACLILFDKKTGQYWQKRMVRDGDNEWRKEESPFHEKDQKR
ncbi:hypothetical protein [Sporosarcina koreensis]|uniref:hypothetical protein n=1 Tax=Sporosarcina koreensis TaxID=334735 RepID=UPI00058EE152|nr:hypothetical protein [Sporosarcina koreensis]